MKIAVSADCFSSFTSGFPVRGMMKHLVKLRKDIQFVLFYTKRDRLKTLQAFYEEIESLSNVEVRYFKYSRRTVAIRRLLHMSLVDKTNEFDMFINPGNPEVWSNLKVPSICSIADFSTLKGYSTGKYACFFKLYNKISLPLLFKQITKIVPISQFTKDDLLRYWPSLKDKVQIVYNGIDDMWHDDKAVKPEDMPFKEKTYFIWWGLISRRKNVTSLVEAYKMIKAKHPDMPNLLLVGRIEEYMADIKKSFNDNIVNIPFQDNYNMKYLVKNSCGLIFPSFYEGFGLPIVEAYSQGVGVACSNVSSLPEIANGLAYLFDPYNVDDISQAIEKLWKAPQCADLLKEYASEYSYIKAAEQYSKIIDSIK